MHGTVNAITKFNENKKTLSAYWTKLPKCAILKKHSFENEHQKNEKKEEDSNE